MPLRSLLAVAVLLDAGTAMAAGQGGGNRYAVVLESQPAAGGPAEDSSELRSVLAENGYQAVPLGGRNREWRIRVERDSLTAVFNNLQFEPGATLLVYYSGVLSLQAGAVQLNDFAGKPMDLMRLFDRLERKLRNPPTVAVLLDVRSAALATELVPVISSRLERYQTQAPVSVLIVRNGSDRAVTPPPLATWLRRALTYDRDADGDRNGHLTMAELQCYVRGKLAGEAEVGLVSTSARGPSIEIGRFGTTTLDGLIQGLADEVLAELGRQPCDLVAIPDLADSPSAAAAGAPRSDAGLLPRYLAAQLQARLGAHLGAKRMVRHDRLIKALKDCHVTPATEDRELDKLRAALPQTGPAAVLRGTAKIDLQAKPATLTVTARLVTLRAGQAVQAIPLRATTARLEREESAMSGCLNMSPKGDTFPGLNWTIGELGAPVELAPHPMADLNFPLKVYLKVNGRQIVGEPSADKRQLYARVAPGNDYVIVIENRSGRDLFLRLLVDGRNTLPDRALEGTGPLEPAQYVSLTRARCWFCKASEPTNEVRGFYTTIDANASGLAGAELRTFRVTDAQTQAAAGEAREQLGIITAAFYECVPRGQSPMAARPRYATTLGDKRTGTVEIYDGQQAPGDLLGEAPINIRYGF